MTSLRLLLLATSAVAIKLRLLHDECVSVAGEAAIAVLFHFEYDPQTELADVRRIRRACCAADLALGEAVRCADLASAQRALAKRGEAAARAGFAHLYDGDDDGVFLVSKTNAVNASLWLADDAGARLTEVARLDAPCDVDVAAPNRPLAMAVPFEGLEATQAWLEATLKRNVVDAPGPVYDDEEVIKIAAVANPFLEWALRRGDAASYAARWADHYGGLGRAIVYRAEDLGDLPNVRHFIRKTASQTGRGVVDAATFAAPPVVDRVLDSRRVLRVWRDGELRVLDKDSGAPVVAATAREIKALAAALPPALTATFAYLPWYFVHVPKTGGKYVRDLLRRCAPLVNYGHHSAARGAEHFLTLREPADRFESMLTMRLAERKPRLDWPGDRVDFDDAKRAPLDATLAAFADEDLLNFAPFRTFGFYASDKSTILCRPGDAFAFLDAFGVVDRDPACAAAPPAPAKAARAQGRFSEASRDRIRRVFADDTSLWRRACA
ncbi:hypothetical protein SO694_00116026 [Aureococcus anophagefferens]|uniref:Uncharacterized protein n=2 Tax=Aureococcus anophagefferens TaxID=44056 RepID=A0ABR1FW98_AURAN|nr:hypothetical protein AURANDRAFT_66796 [Aureococcus anophagefferens]EGB04953.1 hypothetical protein AURANDRAFT_66796 [Aureococcus anophagefferens]KAH8062828.1 hypothetical protein JL720_13199 [Aureococcus anophagefferens]|eukprot:XP_009040307.1 hypothetical protein AURANDRAFT_66796 [Aureococcus anophagefferens]